MGVFLETSEGGDGGTEVDGYAEDGLTVDVGDADADGVSDGCVEVDGDTEVNGSVEEVGMSVGE